jgi:hypothetical protein
MKKTCPVINNEMNQLLKNILIKKQIKNISMILIGLKNL